MNNTADIFNEAVSALRNGNLSGAEARFRLVLQRDGAHVPALNLLTVTLISGGRFAEAEPFIAKAVKLNQSSDVSFYNYGLISKQLNKPQQALEQFSKAIKLNPKIAETWNNRGTVHNELGRYEAAIVDFDRAIALNANYSEAYANKGKSLLALQRPEMALTAYDKALSIRPDLAEAWLGRGNVLYDLKRYDQALAAYDRAVSIRPDLAEAWLGRGSACNELTRHDEAAAAFNKAIALRPDLAQAWLTTFDKALSLKPDSAETWLSRGNVYNDLKRYDEALAAYDEAIALKPDLAEAWHGRGNVFSDLNRPDEAVAAYDQALALKPDLAQAWLGRGNIFAHLRRYDEAFAAFDKAIALKPDLAQAWLGRGNVCNDLKRHDEAFAAYDKALALKPDLAPAWLGRGNVAFNLKRYDRALTDYDKALALKPDFAEAWLGRGNALSFLKRHEEAFAAYDQTLALKPDLAEAWLGRGSVLFNLKRHNEAFTAYDEALTLKPDLAQAWLGRGSVFSELKRHDDAVAAYDQALALEPDLAQAWLARGHAGFDRKRYDEALTAFDKAITLEPDLAEAWLGRGNVCFDLKRHDDALAAFAKALALKPDLAQAWLGRGNVFANLKRYDEAFAAFDKAIALEPDLAAAWFGRGTVCFDLKRHDDAFAAYDKALALKPDLGLAEALRLHAKMHLCDWSNFDTEADHLMNGKERGEPFALLSISNSPGLQLQCARFTSEKIPLPKMPLWHGEIYKHDKIRLGYLSPDFRHHPVAYLLAGVFENHDRRHFQTFAFSTGPGDNSEMRDRLTRAFDQFIDVNGKSDGDIAGQIRALDIDILIDLGGYTADSRVPILAQRAAPVQVNYLGYAGTMGANYVDYLIADRTLVPPSHQIYYTEKIVYLPHCFMPSDAKGRNISDKPLRRSDFGLPENGFVFCCFNNAYKFNPELFRSWMRIMKAIDDSVLWLSELSETARTNLKKHADAAGVDPERLVFAKRLASSSEHLARHKLADLFIDTLPYNAHTTASDALWTGLPVLTQIGETFAARVAASLLNAIGLPELITRSRQDYERLAIELANGPAKLAAIKEKLEANRSIAPLFDTQLFTRHLEAAYRQMSERYRAGLAPDHFAVSAGEIPGR